MNFSYQMERESVRSASEKQKEKVKTYVSIRNHDYNLVAIICSNNFHDSIIRNLLQDHL